MISEKLNPIIVREMRGRMRGRKAFIIMTLYLTFLSCAAGSVYYYSYAVNLEQTAFNVASAPTVQYGPLIGKTIFAWTVMILLTVITFVAPAFTAGAIAGEREQQTYEVLLITPMKAAQIVWGKIGAIMIFLLLMIVAALPIQSFSFLFGGVALAEVLISFAALIATALAYGAMGLFVSSFARTTMIAIITSYGICIPFLFGAPFMLFYFLSIFSPFLAATAVLDTLSEIMLVIMLYGVGILLSLNPYSAAFITGALAAEGQGYFFFTENFGSTVTLWFISPWVIYVVFHLLIAWLLIRMTIKRIARVSDV